MRKFSDWVDDPEKGFYIREDFDLLDGWTGEGKLELFPLQKRIFDHCFTPDDKGAFPYTTIVYSTIKKSGKTTLAAAVGAWYLDEGPANSEIYALANDLEQAQSRVYDDISYHVAKKGGRTQKYVIPAENGSFIKALASEYRSVAGGRQGLTLWDELWGYTSDRSRLLWAEMTPPPTVRNPLRVIVTYAGFEGESELLWQLYEDNFLHGEDVPGLEDIVDDNGETVCRRKGRVFMYWDTVPRMPWQTMDYYEEQMATLRPTDFLRLHRNQWVTTKEEFIPIKFWDEAATKMDAPLIYMREHPAFGLPISVGVDAGIKNDCTAVVGTYFDYTKGEVGMAFHRIWTPPPDEPFDLTVIEDYIKDMARTVPICSVVYDPTQLHQAMTNLAKLGFTTISYTQSVDNMTKATQNLYDLLKNGNFATYPADDMRQHLRFAAAEVKGRGYRLVKPTKSGRHKIDGAIALAMAAYDSVMRGGVDTTQVIRVESPFGDVSEFPSVDSVKEEMEALLPLELRD